VAPNPQVGATIAQDALRQSERASRPCDPMATTMRAAISMMRIKAKISTCTANIKRARAMREQIGRELRKSPDFQLYLIAKSRKDRARMKRVLMQIPRFRLWHILTDSQNATAS
jgi:hypothetical protein